MNVRVRKATLEDWETLRRFEQGVIEAERPFDPTLKQSETYYYDLHHLLTAENIWLVVAVIENEIAGSGYARIEASKQYLQHQQHAYLGFMYVVPHHRGKGINQAIINALKSWAASKGVTELRLEVYADNQSAIKAYEKAGFEKLMVQMRASI